MEPWYDPQKRAALAASVSRTGWRFVGEVLMTRRTSAVAVCCSRASVRSRLRTQLLEQPDVLDGDNSLVGEGLQESAVRVGERPALCAEHKQNADWRAAFV